MSYTYNIEDTIDSKMMENLDCTGFIDKRELLDILP